MKTSLKCLFLAVFAMMFILPATAFAKPHSSHSHGANHEQGHHSKKPPKDQSPPVQQCGLSDAQFANVFELVNSQVFKEDKKIYIGVTAGMYNLTVDQLIQFMNLFVFSSDRIEVAGDLYNYVCDLENYYKVYNEFTLSSQREELNARIYARLNAN